MADDGQAKFMLELTYHEARMLRSALMGRRKKFVHEATRTNFRPQPGKIDKNKVGIEMVDELISRVGGLIDEAARNSSQHHA